MKLNRRLGISDDVIELIQSITEKKKLDPVDKKAVKKDFDDREDKDIDNDGDVDKSDKYLHNRRKAVSKAMSKGKGAKDQVDTEPTLDDTRNNVNEEGIPTGIKIHHQNPQGKKGHMIVFTAKDAQRAHKELKKDGHTVTGHQLMYGTKAGPIHKVNEDVELDEKLETDGPRRTPLRFTMPKSKQAKDYSAKKVQVRRDMNKKNDPGADKKGYALSVLDREKAAKKAKQKMKEEAVGVDEADTQNKYTAAEIRKRRKLPDRENTGTARAERMRRKARDNKMGSLNKEAVGVDPGAVDKHNCATHVYHEQWGQGQTIYSMHADPDEYGLIEWYDVMFDHGIEKAVPTNEMKVTREMSHGNHKKKK